MDWVDIKTFIVNILKCVERRMPWFLRDACWNISGKVQWYV